MKLRTRLFLWVGLIFFLAFGLSLYFEIYSTDTNLKKAEKELQEQILKLNEQKRQKIQDFLHISLSEDQAEIDSLLLQIARDPTVPLDPSHAALLFKNDQWVDLIQTTKDNQIVTLLIPIAYPMETAHQIPIDDQISWVVFNNDRDLNHPYMGVEYQQSMILFNPEALRNFVPRGDDPFLKRVQHASEYLKGVGSMQKDIAQKGENLLFVGKPLELGVKCAEWKGEIIDSRVLQLMQRADQATMLSILTGLFPDIFAPHAPKGIARFTPDSSAGHAILTEQAFFQKKVFNDVAYFQKHPGSKECKGMGTSIAIIAPENMDRVFVGNALQIQGSNYLTIGIDMEQICQDLVLSSHMGVFLVHDGKVINAYTPDGKEIPNPKETIPFDQKMLESTSGVVESRGTNYFYQQMTPFKGLDLHFFIFDLEKNAFALVRTIDEGSRVVISQVSFNMRIIAISALILVLLLLHNIANRISKPITALSLVTKQVAAGQLEGIEMPAPPDGRNDEVTALINDFEQMVTGLKEKEKVKGVLNKVVSPEIAQEILKGQIHLGGEERKVTVFFADIRNFTEISAHREPSRVIEMLNNCMTRVSNVIDAYGGVIDKYVGDEVMALFGAPLEKEDSALKSIQCALKIVEELKQWNAERKTEERVPIEMGIGIHTGNVIAGNMGAENRLNYTVIGSNVNFAARLCSAAKELEILISKETLAEPHVAENIEVEELKSVELKGFEGTYSLYRVLGEKKHV